MENSCGARVRRYVFTRGSVVVLAALSVMACASQYDRVATKHCVGGELIVQGGGPPLPAQGSASGSFTADGVAARGEWPDEVLIALANRECTAEDFQGAP